MVYMAHARAGWFNFLSLYLPLGPDCICTALALGPRLSKYPHTCPFNDPWTGPHFQPA